jgi:hypothetical protein
LNGVTPMSAPSRSDATLPSPMHNLLFVI